MVAFAKPVTGSTIVGRQLEAQATGNYNGLMKGTTVFFHSLESFQQFWEDVGFTTKSKWSVNT